MGALDILEKSKIPYRQVQLSQRSVTSEEVVEHSGGIINADEICNTLVTRDKQNNYYAIFIKALMHIDFKKLKQITGSKMSMLTLAELYDTTGKKPGEICFLDLDMPLYVDRSVFLTNKINFSAGEQNIGIEINSNNLEELLQFKGFQKTNLVDISKKQYIIVNLSK